MINNLENIIGGSEYPKFKSEGERRIAYFLYNNSIKYKYESGILINSDSKPRIWYPDFHLPEFETYIEYFGLAGNSNYDKGIKTKETMYSKMGLDVIPVYPWMFAEDWEGYIMKGLKNVTAHRYRNLMNKPYWPKARSRPHYHSFRSPKRPFY